MTPGGAIPNRFDAPGIFLRQVGNTLGQQRLGHAALYFQDSWRAAPGLTLDMGFRWAGQFNQTPEVGNDLLIERVSRANFSSGAVSPGSLPDDLGQWMPRLGFAYSRQGSSRRFVLRGSAGIFHAITPPVFFNASTKAFREPAFNLPVALPTKHATVYQQFLAAGIDLNQYPLAELPVFSPDEVARVLDGDRYAGATPQTVSPDFRNPRSIKYTLAFEYELTDASVVGLQWDAPPGDPPAWHEELQPDAGRRAPPMIRPRYRSTTLPTGPPPNSAPWASSSPSGGPTTTA